MLNTLKPLALGVKRSISMYMHTRITSTIEIYRGSGERRIPDASSCRTGVYEPAVDPPSSPRLTRSGLLNNRVFHERSHVERLDNALTSVTSERETTACVTKGAGRGLLERRGTRCNLIFIYYYY